MSVRCIFFIMNLSCSSYGITLQNTSSYIVVNQSCSWMSILLAFPTTFANLVLLIAFATSAERKKSCSMLLMNLAITDLLAGVVVMPGHSMIFRYIANGKSPCNFANFSLPVAFSLGGTSLFTVALIAVDRYISIFHPFYYQSELSRTKVALGIILSWIVPIIMIMPLVFNWHITHINGSIAASTIFAICVNFYCYVRIFLRARKVRLQIQAETRRFGEGSTNQAEKRFIFVGVVILLSVLICYTPLGAMNFARGITQRNSILDHMRCVEWVFLNSNSLVNPLITGIFVPPIRNRILKLLRCNRVLPAGN